MALTFGFRRGNLTSAAFLKAKNPVHSVHLSFIHLFSLSTNTRPGLFCAGCFTGEGDNGSCDLLGALPCAGLCLKPSVCLNLGKLHNHMWGRHGDTDLGQGTQPVRLGAGI